MVLYLFERLLSLDNTVAKVSFWGHSNKLIEIGGGGSRPAFVQFSQFIDLSRLLWPSDASSYG